MIIKEIFNIFSDLVFSVQPINPPSSIIYKTQVSNDQNNAYFSASSRVRTEPVFQWMPPHFSENSIKIGNSESFEACTSIKNYFIGWIESLQSFIIQHSTVIFVNEAFEKAD